MRVCHIISGHIRKDPRVFRKECTYLAKNGYEVVLLCSDGKPDEYIEGISIHSIEKIPTGRIERFLFSPKAFFKEAKLIDADIYHIHEPFLLGVAAKLKKIGKKVIFDSHEDTVNDIKQKTYIPKPFRELAAKFYEKKEKRIVSKMDAVITVTPAIVEKFEKFAKKTVMVTNYPIFEEYSVNKEEYMSRDNAICFAGLADSLWNIHLAVAALENIDCRFKLVAANINDEYKAQLSSLKSFVKVDMYPVMPYKNVVSDIYLKSTIGVALIGYNSNYCGNIGTLGNTKLFEYMMLGLPVICTDFILWKEIVEKNGCGICVGSGNLEDIKSAVKYLCENKEIAYEMGQKGKALVKEKYNWETQLEVLLKLYREI